MEEVQRYKFRGSSGKVNMALDALPDSPTFTETGPAHAGTHRIDRNAALSQIGDVVLSRKGEDIVAYFLASAFDDADQGITHVIRGDDHVNNTPRQINIFKALGKEPPVYAHLPTVLNEQGEKLSKRNGAKAVTAYAAEGFLPEAMVNYLARLGWSHGDDEIFSREQFLQWFDLDHLGKSAAQFDEAKLRWVNAQHIKASADAQLVQWLKPFLAERGAQMAPERAERALALGREVRAPFSAF